jgi:hypothetical protein
MINGELNITDAIGQPLFKLSLLGIVIVKRPSTGARWLHHEQPKTRQKAMPVQSQEMSVYLYA